MATRWFCHLYSWLWNTIHVIMVFSAEGADGTIYSCISLSSKITFSKDRRLVILPNLHELPTVYSTTYYIVIGCVHKAFVTRKSFYYSSDVFFDLFDLLSLPQHFATMSAPILECRSMGSALVRICSWVVLSLSCVRRVLWRPMAPRPYPVSSKMATWCGTMLCHAVKVSVLMN